MTGPEPKWVATSITRDTQITDRDPAVRVFFQGDVAGADWLCVSLKPEDNTSDRPTVPPAGYAEVYAGPEDPAGCQWCVAGLGTCPGQSRASRRPAPRWTSGALRSRRCSTGWPRAMSWSTTSSRWARTGRGSAGPSRPSTRGRGNASSTSPPAPAPRASRSRTRGVTVVPTDLSLGMLEVGRRRRPALSFIAADALRLPYADGGVRAAATISSAPAPSRTHSPPCGSCVGSPGRAAPWWSASSPRRAGAPFQVVYSELPDGRAAPDRPADLVEPGRRTSTWPSPSRPGRTSRGWLRSIGESGWRDVEWRNLSGGIVALHRAKA